MCQLQGHNTTDIRYRPPSFHGKFNCIIEFKNEDLSSPNVPTQLFKVRSPVRCGEDEDLLVPTVITRSRPQE